MKVLNFDYDLKFGFAWIIVDGKNDGDEWKVQCCTENENDDKPIKVIVQNACGHDWGICGDANKAAFEYWGENRCMTALFEEAKKAGFDLTAKQ